MYNMTAININFVRSRAENTSQKTDLICVPDLIFTYF